MLSCAAANANPNQPVVWVKDGLYFQSPYGSDLCITYDTLYLVSGWCIDDVQGFYHCEVWGQEPNFYRVASQQALVTFFG